MDSSESAIAPGSRIDERGHEQRTRSIKLNGQRVTVTEVFDSYWYLAAERQAMFFRRIEGKPSPWTDDDVLSRHRFTNAYRASDRVSQYLLQRVIYDTDRDALDTVLRILLFKVFNRIDTWEHLVFRVGEPDVSSFDCELYSRILDERLSAGERVYSAAYVMPDPKLGHDRKHHNHLALLHELLNDGSLTDLFKARTLEDLYGQLLSIASFGRFLAFQYAIDLNYSPHFNFREMDFVVAGPGAIRGIAKCFEDTGGLTPEEIIACMAVSTDEFMNSGRHAFQNLDGRSLQLVDCQNLFCEVDKYARMRHPDRSNGGPNRIKQHYTPDRRPISLGYPPKWNLRWSADTPSVQPEPVAPHMAQGSFEWNT